MKTLKHILAAGCLMGAFSGCSDFLDVTSQESQTYDTSFQSEEDCRSYTASLYQPLWFDFASFAYIIGDCRSNNYYSTMVTYSHALINRFMELSATEDLESGWNSLYSVVTQAGHILKAIDRAAANGVSQEAIDGCKGEARFMRGLAYWYLLSCWGNVPVIEDAEVLADDYMVHSNYLEDVLHYAIRDVEYAAAHLPETDEPGRLTRYSAYGLLARLYVTAACYARGGHFTEGRYETSPDYYYGKAAEAALEVCEHGTQYALLDDYEELFRVQNNNNSESLFSLQYVAGSTSYGVGNINQRNLAYSTGVLGGLTTWGGAIQIGGDLVDLMTERGERARKRATCFYNGAVYDYLGGATEEGVWVASGLRLNRCYPKKEVVGGPEDTDGIAINGNSGFMTPMLRLAEVYLLYAEAVLGTQESTSDPNALYYFNRVRQRARYERSVEGGDPTIHDGTDGTELILPDLTSLTLQDIREERRCELAGEGQFWYDIVRWAYWQQNEALAFLNNQKRQIGYIYNNETFVWQEANASTIMPNPATPERLTLPYPLTETTMNPLLDDKPEHFDVLPEDAAESDEKAIQNEGGQR